MAGVASVCLPTNWAGPSPSRKSLNWLLAPRFTPEKIKLPQKTQNSPLLTLKITNLYTNVSSVLLMAPLSQHMWWIHFAASRRISLALIIYNKKKYLRDCPSDRKHPVLIWLCLSFGFIVASHSPRWLIFNLCARYIRLCLLSVGQHIQKYPQAGMDVSLRTCWHAVITVTLTHFIQDVFVTQRVQMTSSRRTGLLTSPQSCSCSCCRCWTLCWAAGSCSSSAPLPCRSPCSSGWTLLSPSYSSPLEVNESDRKNHQADNILITDSSEGMALFFKTDTTGKLLGWSYRYNN